MEHGHLGRIGLTRRGLLRRSGMGFGMLGMAGLVAPGIGAGRGREVVGAEGGGGVDPMGVKAPHFLPKVKRVIHIFLNGGLSHVDSFDPKPALSKYDGKALPIPKLLTERETGSAFGSPFKFRKYGKSGIEVSDLFPHVGAHVDDICFIRSMYAHVPNHEPSLMLMNTGSDLLVRPSMGSWLTYGLGTENANLPGFVAMCPGGYPIKGPDNWRPGFLPGIYGGAYVNTQHTKVDRLIENVRNGRLLMKEQRAQLDLLRAMNERHLEGREGEGQLEARIASFEQAYRMQMAASDAFDVGKEPEKVREMYGKSVQSRQILIARRLVERGVRFVQVWHGRSQPWDNHDQIKRNHGRLAGECSQAIGALLADLKQRGLFEDTLVICGGEFGRTPTVETRGSGSKLGRDHNHYGFTMWLAGGGVKGGTVYGATDEFGFKAVKDRVSVHDLHATILHLMGFDHENLTYRYAGRDFRLTDVHGEVVGGVIG